MSALCCLARSKIYERELFPQYLNNSALSVQKCTEILRHFNISTGSLMRYEPRLFYCCASSNQTLVQERLIYFDELISLRAEYSLAYSYVQ